MIDRVEIRNWQSLRNLDIELGRFTVIVGESNSGKSAFMRAVQALASGQRGTSEISFGAKSAAITARSGATSVTLEYSGKRWKYRAVVDGVEQPDYNKTYGIVPPEVTAILGMEPVTSKSRSVSFFTQFDTPYLLKEPGSVVARTLGQLTNVNILHEGSRAGSARAQESGVRLREKQADLESVLARSTEFLNLPQQLELADAADVEAGRAKILVGQITRLDALIAELSQAEAVTTTLAQRPPVPTAEAVTAAQARFDRFNALLGEWMAGNNAMAAARTAIDAAERAEAELGKERHDLLVAAGTCPTCAQSTRNL